MKTFYLQQTVVVRNYNTEHIQNQGEVSQSIIFFRYATVVFLAFLLSCASMQAQYCNPNVPTFTVNLTGSPNGSWISPNVSRVDNCCGSLPPDNCVQFIVTLDPNSQGIIFDIFSGAVPTGALYYQVNCNPPTPVGQPICLIGVGPHYITFCKPGNNNNEYIITSISQPGTGPGITVNDGCMDTIHCFGLDESSITWNSVYPGPVGFYNSYLTCQAGCDTTIVNGQPNSPMYIDFLVCGLPYGGCDSLPYCDSIRVYFNSTLISSIIPQNPTICFGNPGTWITASATGGAQPYSYLWNTGSTAQTIFVGPGTYSVVVSDTTDCPASIATVTVTAFTAPITANAGPNTSTCNTSPSFQLNGVVTGASGGVWTGGSGSYNPNNTTLNATYTPSAAEISAGFVTLILTTTGNGTCPGDADTITLFINSFQVAVAPTSTMVSCFGGSNGSASPNASGGTPPYSYSWNTVPVQTTGTATGLPSGTYTVTITDGNGCTGTASVMVTEPPVLSLSTAGFTTSCYGGCNGQATVIPSGGAGNFSYLWSSGPTAPSINNLCTGTYTVTVTDQNGCSRSDTAIVSQPSQITMTSSSSAAICGQANGSASISPSGGTPGYTYLWTPSGQTNSTATGLPPGNYVVTITDNNGCAGSMTVQVNNVQQLPVVSFTSNDNQGCGSVCIQFTNTSAGAVTAFWNFGDNTTSTQMNPLHCYASPGAYTVSLTVTNAAGCSNTQVMPSYITVFTNPVANFSLGPQPTTILDPEICFTDHSTTDVITWYWNFDDPNDLAGSAEQNPCHTYSDTGTYCASLIVHNSNGCWNTISYCLRIQPYFTLYVPNAFTPNGDGMNDEFLVVGSTLDENTYEMLIFDRWGKNIFATEKWGKGWDGHVNGGSQVVPIGVYVYKIKVRDYTGKLHQLTGHVSVIK